MERPDLVGPDAGIPILIAIWRHSGLRLSRYGSSLRHVPFSFKSRRRCPWRVSVRRPAAQNRQTAVQLPRPPGVSTDLCQAIIDAAGNGAGEEGNAPRSDCHQGGQLNSSCQHGSASILTQSRLGRSKIVCYQPSRWSTRTRWSGGSRAAAGQGGSASWPGVAGGGSYRRWCLTCLS